MSFQLLKICPFLSIFSSKNLYVFPFLVRKFLAALAVILLLGVVVVVVVVLFSVDNEALLGVNVVVLSKASVDPTSERHSKKSPKNFLLSIES